MKIKNSQKRLTSRDVSLFWHEVEKHRFQWKHRKDAVNSRTLAEMLMRSLCNYRCSDICRLLGNITQSRVSKLCIIGYKLMGEDEKYKNILNEFVKEYSA